MSVIEREKVCPLRLISAKDPNKAGCFGMLCMWYQPEAETCTILLIGEGAVK